jgi:CrcB protein
METLTKVAFVAAGGAAGAVARHLVNVSPLARIFDNFPLPTFSINVAGSFLIGFLLILLTDKYDINDNLRMAIIVGFIGAFTTFSTFEMEIYGLVREKLPLTALLYLILSVAGGFLGLVAGVSLARKF